VARFKQQTRVNIAGKHSRNRSSMAA